MLNPIFGKTPVHPVKKLAQKVKPRDMQKQAVEAKMMMKKKSE